MTSDVSSLDRTDNLMKEVITLIAESITKFVMNRISKRRIKEVNVTITLKDRSRLLFEIDVEIITDALVRDEEVKNVADEAVDYGFKLLDEVISLIRGGVNDLGEIRRAIKRIERKFIDTDSQKH